MADLARPWSGELLRHRPRASTRSVLDDTYLGMAGDNRWSALGLLAYYFALDVGVLVAEHARHIEADLPGTHGDRLERSVFRVPVELEVVLDLTDPAVVGAMGAGAINAWILDLRATQAAASHLLSQVRGLQGLIVPSVAFLDQHARFNIVVYRDTIDVATAFGSPIHELDIVLAASGA